MHTQSHKPHSPAKTPPPAAKAPEPKKAEPVAPAPSQAPSRAKSDVAPVGAKLTGTRELGTGDPRFVVGKDQVIGVYADGTESVILREAATLS